MRAEVKRKETMAEVETMAVTAKAVREAKQAMQTMTYEVARTLQGLEMLELGQNLADARALAEATQAEVIKARDALRKMVALEGGSLGAIVNATWANWWRRFNGGAVATVPPLPVMDLRAQWEEARKDACSIYLVSAEFVAPAGSDGLGGGLSDSIYALRPGLANSSECGKAWFTSGSKDSWAWGYAPRVAKHWAKSSYTKLAYTAKGERAPFMAVIEQDGYHGSTFNVRGAGAVDRQTHRLMQLMVEHHYAMLGVVVAANRSVNTRSVRWKRC